MSPINQLDIGVADYDIIDFLILYFISDLLNHALLKRGQEEMEVHFLGIRLGILCIADSLF